MNRRLMSFATLAFTSFTSIAADAPTSPLSASELLDKFAATQQQLKSFIAQYEINRQDTVSGPQIWKGSYSKAGETRFDGRRLSDRTRWWGQIRPETIRTQADPIYKSWLFDGEWLYSFEQDFLRPDDKRAKGQTQAAGLLTVRQPPTPLGTLSELLDRSGSDLMLLLGRLPHDQARFDARIRGAASLRVRDKLEPAGAEPSACYVLEGDTTGGRYTVWLDPAHGYQIAKAILARQPGHQRAANSTLSAGERDLSTVDKVRFAKFGGVWVPVQASVGLDNTFTPKLGTSSMRMQINVTKFLPDPDHDAQRSFLPNDIRNGARAIVLGPSNPSGAVHNYHWSNGKVLDPEGEVVFDSGKARPNPAAVK